MRKKPKWWWLTVRFGGLLDIIDGFCLLISGRSFWLSFKFTAWDAKRTLERNLAKRRHT